MSSIHEYMENEWFVVRYSGEIPEIAYNSSLFFLTEAQDGPQFPLSEIDVAFLKKAACERFKEIILRDILPENRTTTMYRGVKRSIINYRRFQKFCIRQGLNEHEYASEVAASLLLFLGREAVDVAKGLRTTAVNCSFEELNEFAVSVGLVSHILPDGIGCLCERQR